MPWLATARFALEDRNDALFRQTTREMVQRFPNNPQAQYFEGVGAVQDQDWRSAEKALRKARELGMNDESLAQLLKMAIDNQRWIWQYAKILTLLVAVWLVGLAAIVFFGRILSKRTLRTIRDGEPLSRTAADRWTRSAYRAIVFLASVNYFVSLPLMLVLAIALQLALSYAVLMTPYLNLWLVAFILIGGVGGIVTAASGLRTAFVKIPETSIGRSLRPGEAPKLWEFVRAVARDAGMRPVDDIWVTPASKWRYWNAVPGGKKSATRASACYLWASDCCRCKRPTLWWYCPRICTFHPSRHSRRRSRGPCKWQWIDLSKRSLSVAPCVGGRTRDSEYDAPLYYRRTLGAR